MLQVYCLTGCDTTSGSGCDTTSGMFSEGQMDGRMYGWTNKDSAYLNKSGTVLEVQFL